MRVGLRCCLRKPVLVALCEGMRSVAMPGHRLLHRASVLQESMPLEFVHEWLKLMLGKAGRL
jgi:hypothetical protein